MKLSIIIPIFNEEKTIAKVLDSLEKADTLSLRRELVVVDDGSTDKTIEIIENYIKSAKEKNIIFVKHKKNQGKGAAVRTGIEKASGDYILIQDADLEYHPTDIAKLLKPIIEGKAKVVYGTRLKRLPNFKRDERTPHFFLHYIGNKCLSLLASVMYFRWITDMETGYKIFPKKPLKEMHLSANGFSFDPELTVKFIKRRYKIIELPISTSPRGYDEGKKLNTITDGFSALWTLIKYRFVD